MTNLQLVPLGEDAIALIIEHNGHVYGCHDKGLIRLGGGLRLGGGCSHTCNTGANRSWGDKPCQCVSKVIFQNEIDPSFGKTISFKDLSGVYLRE